MLGLQRSKLLFQRSGTPSLLCQPRLLRHHPVEVDDRCEWGASSTGRESRDRRLQLRLLGGCRRVTRCIYQEHVILPALQLALELSVFDPAADRELRDGETECGLADTQPGTAVITQ